MDVILGLISTFAELVATFFDLLETGILLLAGSHRRKEEGSDEDEENTGETHCGRCAIWFALFYLY